MLGDNKASKKWVSVACLCFLAMRCYSFRWGWHVHVLQKFQPLSVSDHSLTMMDGGGNEMDTKSRLEVIFFSFDF